MERALKLGINSKDIVRKLPEWAEIVREINGVKVYNMSVFDNIMSYNQDNLDGDAIDYYGTKVTYGELPALRDAYSRGLKLCGVKENDVVTLCLPVSIENLMLLFSVNQLNAITNNVNFLFLKHDFERYTLEKHSEIIVTLDAYLPYFVDHLQNSNIKKVLIMSLDDFLPAHKKGMFLNYPDMPKKMKSVFNPEKIMNCMMNLHKIKGVQFLRLMDVLQHGMQSDIEVPHGPIDIDRDVTYYYTSGTTGAPKCVVYKSVSVNAYLEMHNGLDTKDYVGQRCFQVIPLTHMTGERVCAYMPMARGGTLVPQPIYNKDTFGKDLAATKCDYVVAAASFYMAAVKQGVMGPDALKYLRRPGSGGEPATKAGVKQIDDWLRANGCNVRYSLGGGASEEGGATLVTYFMDEKTKTNETGKPLDPYIMVKLLDEDGNPVPDGELGYMHTSTPCSADRYLDNPEATAARWYYDENGIRWGITGDIAKKNPDGSYHMLGRASDSYVNEDGERIFLFQKEYSLDPEDPVVEWEITAFPVGKNHHHVVGQIILRPGTTQTNTELINYLCKKYELDAVKFYPEFELGEVTGKRDYLLLLHDYVGYYAPCDENHVKLINYSDRKTYTEEIVDNEVVDSMRMVYSKKLA